MPHVNIIAALGRNREIGKGGKLLWPIKDDLRNFKTVTMGKPIIMGRKTYESIGRALPGRQNIVVTRNKTFAAPGVIAAGSFSEALSVAKRSVLEARVKEFFVIGGGELYREALPYAKRLYLTMIDATEPEADSFFPEYEEKFSVVGMESARLKDPESGLYYQFVVRHTKKPRE